MNALLQIFRVTAERWKDFEALFEGRGGPKTCWCMIWRDYDRNAASTDSCSRKFGMRQRILADEPVGLLGYVDGQAVAWCSVAPRQTFKPTLTGKTADLSEDRIWSLTCFYVKRAYRGKAISDKLVEAAIALARSKGAKIIEAYPVASDSPSYRFSGFLDLFSRHGFQKTGTIGMRRNIVFKVL